MWRKVRGGVERHHCSGEGWRGGNRCEEGGEKTRKYSKSCIRNGQTDGVQCEAGRVSHFGAVLVSLKPLISLACVQSCACWEGSGKQRMPVALQGPWEAEQSSLGLNKWQSYTHGAAWSNRYSLTQTWPDPFTHPG